MSAATWAELTNRDDGARFLVNPAAVLMVYDDERAEVTILLTSGDRVRVSEPYRRVSQLLHEAAQAGVAA